MQVTINSLVLEITRRCNMQCEHCIRGKSQNIDMDTAVIDKLFESGVDFYDVCFTGGDPSLYPKAIQYFAERLRNSGRRIGFFYVKTNGKHESMPLVTALLDLYTLVDEPEMCSLSVSRDQFHEGYDDPLLYQGLRFYQRAEDESPRHNEYSNNQIINEGLAFDNGWGGTAPRDSAFQFDEGWDEDHVIIEQVQIAANGNICGQCDISYEREDEETTGNILKKDMNEIIARAYEKYEQELEQA